MIEENGHVWAERFVLLTDRCRNCQMRYNYYLDIKRASKEQPKREDLKEWLKCKRE